MDSNAPAAPETMVERHILQDVAPKSKDDEEILKFIDESRPNIYVVGAGGSGNPVNPE